jgi:hypothetical protein
MLEVKMSKQRARRAVIGAVIGAAMIIGADSALAGKANVLEVAATCKANICNFKVRIRHHDEGWEHYVDRWEVLDVEGNVLATRNLRHPHVEEQPFERGQNGVEIPKEINRVVIRAHDKYHGFGGKTVWVELER